MSVFFSLCSMFNRFRCAGLSVCVCEGYTFAAGRNQRIGMDTSSKQQKEKGRSQEEN